MLAAMTRSPVDGQTKAKAVRKYVDKMIQLAKDGSLHARRQVGPIGRSHFPQTAVVSTGVTLHEPIPIILIQMLPAVLHVHVAMHATPAQHEPCIQGLQP